MGSSDGSLPDWQIATFSLCSHIAGREEEGKRKRERQTERERERNREGASSVVFSYKDTKIRPDQGSTPRSPFNPNCLITLSAVTLGVRASTCEFMWGGGDTVPIIGLSGLLKV